MGGGSEAKTFFSTAALKGQTDEIRSLVSGTQEFSAAEKKTLLDDLEKELSAPITPGIAEFGYKSIKERVQTQIGDAANKNVIKQKATAEGLKAMQQAVNPKLQSNIAATYFGATRSNAGTR